MKTKLAREITPVPSVEDRFSIARSYLKKIGIILSLYSSAIRAINSAPTILKTKEDSAINSFAVASALLPIKISPTLSEAFTLAAGEFYPQEFSNLKSMGNLEIRAILKLFSANEIASILGITYFYKLLSKSCDRDEFLKIAPILSVYLRLGTLVGSQSGTSFGKGGGLAAAGLRILALSVLMKANLKAFKKYRKLIQEKGELNHLDFEIDNFGCTHLDIASILAGDLGFGPVAREAFINFQIGRAKSSTPEGILWNHTLVETSKMFREKFTQEMSNSDISNLDGYKWLWGKSSSDEVLPGVEIDEITNLIPNQTSEVGSPSIMIEQSEPSRDLSILIVEDDPISAKLLQKHFNSLGSITIKESAESAMALLTAPMQSLPFDIILLDIGLPGMSGLELLNDIRAQEKSLDIPAEALCRVFMITSDETPQTVMQAFSQGANGYLTKPLNRHEIKAELAKHDIILGED